MAEDQRTDPGVLAFKTAESSLCLEDVSFHGSGATLICDLSTGWPQPLVPAVWCQRVFEAVHSLSHPGVKGLVNMVGAKFVWPRLCKDVRVWMASCVACQRAKVHSKAPLGQFDIPLRKFEHVHVDLVGPLPSSRGFTHLLTVVDRTTRLL